MRNEKKVGFILGETNFFLMIVQRFLIISERLSSHSQCNYQFTGLIIIINGYYLVGF